MSIVLVFPFLSIALGKIYGKMKKTVYLEKDICKELWI